MNMSGGEGRKVDIDMVHYCIEQCLKLYMSRKEAARTLFIQKNIKPQITEIVWQRLEEQNQEFFKAYYLNLAVKDQIMEFNKLLADQVEVMQRTGLGVSSMQMPNGSNIPAIQQVHRAREYHGCAMGSNGMHTPAGTNAFTNYGPTMDSCMQSPLGISAHNRGVDVSSNMFLAQSRSMGIRPMLNNGGVVKREANYATSYCNYAAPSNLMVSHSAMADPSVSSFSSVNSGLQPLNGSLLDTDASSFGLLGQLSQNLNLQNLIADIASHTDILDGYSDSPFISSNSNNILGPRGHISRFG